MSYQSIFKRYELKFLITTDQKEIILREIEPYMALDQYGRTTIRNVYFDTDNYRLIRRSIEKPAYKEKLRIRSYAQATHDSTVFVELKKKYNKVVYKRRLSLSEQDAMAWLCGESPCPLDTQISREIDYFKDYYGELKPSVFLSYDREAFYTVDGGDFRVTFDDNIFCRQTDVFLTSPAYGEPIMPSDTVMMEIKCSGGIPLWLVSVLSREKIYKTSFSKYGTAYQTLIFSRIHTQRSKEQILYGCNI